MPQNLFRNERNAVTTDADESIRQDGARGAGQLDNFRNVGKIVAGKCDYVRPPLSNQAVKIPVRFALQIN